MGKILKTHEFHCFFSRVFMAKHTDGHQVALKKVILKEETKDKKEKNRDGVRVPWFSFRQFPITTMRELDILKSMNHPNIIRLEGIVSFSESIYIC